MSGQQLAFLVAADGPAAVIAANLELIKDALEDAAAWREHLEDERTAEAYEELAAEIERAEDDSPQQREVA